MADAFGFRFDGSFQHVGVDTFGKYDTLRAAAGSVIKLAGQFGFVSHQFAQVYAVSVPVFDFRACHSAFHGCSRYGTGNFGDEARVYRFRDEVFRTEREVIHMICCVYYIGYRLFGQVGDGVYCCDFHFFVDCFRVRVECATEDVWESDHVVDLVGIVGTSGGHQYVGAGVHCFFVSNFRIGVCQCEDDRHRSHAAHHILAQYVAFGQAEEHVCAFDCFFQRVDIRAVCGKISLLFVEVGTCLADNAFAVQHDDVFETCPQRYI